MILIYLNVDKLLFFMKNRILFLLLFTGLISTQVCGQVSQGGKPLTLANIELLNKKQQIVLAPLSNKNLKSLYLSGNEYKNGTPFVFAHSIWANYSPLTHGEWFNTIDGRDVWVLSLKSPNAFSLNVMFRKFKLPASGKLFLYNPDRTVVLGAFTHKNNKSDSLFATSPIAGDEIIIEYSQDSSVDNRMPFEVVQINHDFLDVFSFLKSKVGGFGTSGECNIDIEADPSYSFLPQERSVCKIIVGGKELCTGTMLANTSNDSTIYFLTAAHCVSNQSEATNTLFYYNYQSPHGFAPIQGSIDFQTSGATLVASLESGDYSLLKLEGEKPRVDYRPYLSGWNRSTSPPSPFFAIHHPSGDVKKISRSSSSVNATSFNAPPFLSDFHWQVPVWDSGTTEGGSSGCALFDASGNLIGSLSGGDAYCDSSVNDYFVRFNKAWNTMSTHSAQLAHWLDPENKSLPNQPLFGNPLYQLENAQRVTNIMVNDLPSFRKANSTLALGLYSQSPIVKVAEKFQFSTSKKIEGVYVVVGKGSSSVNGDVRISFWSGTDSPESEIHSFNTPLSYFISQREKYLKLNSDVIVKGDVFVNIELISSVANDTLGIYLTDIKKDATSRSSNTLLVNDGFEWKHYSEVYGEGKNCSSWIDLVVSGSGSNSIIEKEDDIGFVVEPLCADEKLFIKYSDEKLLINTIYLVSMDGVSYQMPFYYSDKNKIQVDVSHMLRGVYVLNIISNTNLKNYKIIIE